MNLCNNNENGFRVLDVVKIQNNGMFYIFFDLEYDIGSQHSAIGSAMFGQGESSRISLPKNATGIKIDVYLSRDEFTWNKKFTLRYDTATDYCYNVSGTFDQPNLTRVPCDVSVGNSNCSCNNCCCNNYSSNCNMMM